MTEQQFTISVSDEAIDDLRRRLRQTRWPDTVAGSGWTYGADVNWMKSIADHWLNEYDWRAQERKLNAYPHSSPQLVDSGSTTCISAANTRRRCR